jgi:hypothetical protein
MPATAATGPGHGEHQVGQVAVAQGVALWWRVRQGELPRGGRVVSGAGGRQPVGAGAIPRADHAVHRLRRSQRQPGAVQSAGRLVSGDLPDRSAGADDGQRERLGGQAVEEHREVGPAEAVPGSQGCLRPFAGGAPTWIDSFLSLHPKGTSSCARLHVNLPCRRLAAGQPLS